MLPVAQSNHFFSIFFIEKLPKHKRLFKNPFINFAVFFDNSQVTFAFSVFRVVSIITFTNADV